MYAYSLCLQLCLLDECNAFWPVKVIGPVMHGLLLLSVECCYILCWLSLQKLRMDLFGLLYEILVIPKGAFIRLSNEVSYLALFCTCDHT